MQRHNRFLHACLVVVLGLLPAGAALGATTVGNNVSVGGTLSVTGSASLSSTFAATGLSTLTGGFISNASSSVGAGGLQVAGALNASSTFQVSGASVLAGAATLSSTLGVTGLSTLTGGFVSSASSTVANTLSVTGATTVSSTLSINGTLSILNATAVSSTGVFAFGGKTPQAYNFIGDNDDTGAQHTVDDYPIAGDDDLMIAGSLEVFRIGFFDSGLIVNASSSIGSSLAVTGAATVSSTITASGLATLSGGLLSTASTTVANTLSVTGAATVSSTLTVAGTVKPEANNSRNLGAYGTAFQNLYASGTVFTNTVNAVGNATLGDTSADTITLNGRFSGAHLIPSANNDIELGAYGNAMARMFSSSTAFIQNLTIGNGSNGDGYLSWAYEGTNTRIYSPTAGLISFRVNGIDKMNIINGAGVAGDAHNTIDLGLFSSSTLSIGAWRDIYASGTLYAASSTYFYPTGTTTMYVKSGQTGSGGRIVLEDSDGSGCYAVYVNNGTVVAELVSCPD